MKPVTGQRRIRIQRIVVVNSRHRMPLGGLLVNLEDTAKQGNCASRMSGGASSACGVMWATDKDCSGGGATAHDHAANAEIIPADQQADRGDARPICVELILFLQKCDTPRRRIG